MSLQELTYPVYSAYGGWSTLSPPWAESGFIQGYLTESRAYTNLLYRVEQSGDSVLPPYS